VNNGPDFQQLLRNSLAVLLLCAALVLLCYWFVDRPVAFYVHERRFADYPALKWLTYPPPILQAWVPVVLVALMVRRVWGPSLLDLFDQHSHSGRIDIRTASDHVTICSE